MFVSNLFNFFDLYTDYYNKRTDLMNFLEKIDY